MAWPVLTSWRRLAWARRFSFRLPNFAPMKGPVAGIVVPAGQTQFEQPKERRIRGAHRRTRGGSGEKVSRELRGRG